MRGKTYFVQGHQGRASSHILRLRPRVYAPLRVRLVDHLLHLLYLVTGRGT